MAIMLTVGLVETWRAQPSAGDWVWFGLVQLLGGIAIGLAVGRAGTWVMRRARLGATGMYPVLALSVCGLSYGLAAQAGASGFLAVYVAGVVVGAGVSRHRRDIRTFHEALANTAEIGLFLLLGVLVFPSQLGEVALPALAVTALLVLLARPVAVLVCLPWFRFRLNELALIAWAGLRGAVPIVLATIPFTAGYPDGALIFDAVFFVVLVSAAVQGASIPWVARRLGLGDRNNILRPVAEAFAIDGVDADLIEVHVSADLHISGKRLKEVPLPDGVVLTAVMRGERILVPGHNTRLRNGDLLLLAHSRKAGQSSTSAARAWARGELVAADPY
jgi:cell volume regulation protein A